MRKSSEAASLFPEGREAGGAYRKKPQGYWNDFANVKRELLAFIESHGTPGVMPTNTDLGKAGRSDLQNALAKHGGYPSVAARLRLACAKKQQGYWDDFANVGHELLAFIEEHGTPSAMPTSVELGKAGRGDLAAAISKHGGYPSVAARLGLACAKKQQSYWDDFANVKRELLTFIEKHGTPGVMPTQDQLTKAKRGDLKNAISKKHGGYPAVAKQLGLEFTCTAKPRGYWGDFSNVERELLAFIKEHGTPGVMPTAAELAKAGRGDLTGAISNHHSGYLAVAEQLGLKLAYVAKLPGYWDDFANLERELRAFIQEHNTSGVMPTKEEFAKAGRSDLTGALRKHGSYSTIAERLGLKLAYATKPPGYWDDFANLERELHAFTKEHGTPGMMPADTDLTRAGRSDLKNAIRRRGGYPTVAERLGLEFSYKAKPSGYWDSFSNVERELLAFIKEYGTPGEIPTDRELREARRSDLAFALQVHGGYLAVARRLNLTYARLERISPKTASEAEKTARAIQPLAESNLLSGAQVMVILRRAGLLKFRNQRVVRLNAGLARGDHDAIESAVTQLVSGSTEPFTETVTIEASEDLTAAEVEALVSEDLSTDVPKSLAGPSLASTTPDIQREQAIIRGLSALGELRLPLDEVLGLLTSKILWEAFYRRLYA